METISLNHQNGPGCLLTSSEVELMETARIFPGSAASRKKLLTSSEVELMETWSALTEGTRDRILLTSSEVELMETMSNGTRACATSMIASDFFGS